jgi:hypothetical protein
MASREFCCSARCGHDHAAGVNSSLRESSELRFVDDHPEITLRHLILVILANSCLELSTPY